MQIISEKQAIEFARVQVDTYKYLKAVNYPMTKIANSLGIARQTVTRRFQNHSWTSDAFLRVIILINSKK